MNNNEKTTVRTWLIEAREKKHLSQTDLGRLVGVSSNCINQYERNRRFPKPMILVKLCKVLEILPNAFYKEE